VSVSPDGRLVTGFFGTAGLVVRDLITGETRNLTDDGSPGMFSPEGDQIAYTSWLGERDSVVLSLIRTDGSDQRLLFRDADARSINVADWTEDGSRILVGIEKFDATVELAYVPVDGGAPEVIVSLNPGEPVPGGIAISPDGRFIAYDVPSELDGFEHDIYVMSGDGGAPVPLVEDDADDRLLAWSLDGTEILFASDRTGTVDIWSLPVSNGIPQEVPRVVKHNVGQLTPIGFARDGSYYFGVRHSDCHVYVASLDSETGELAGPHRKVAPAVRHTGTDWSPDGRRLAFVTPSRGVLPDNWAVTVRTLATGDERRFTLPAEGVLHQLRPLWSPDGQRLIAKGWERNAWPRVGVYAVAVETGEVTKLFSTPDWWQRSIDWVNWSADGGAVLFAGDSGIVMHDLTSGRETYLLSSSAGGRLAPSPDGRWLAFGAYDPETETDALVVVSLPGREHRVLAEAAPPTYIWPPAWTPDSRHLIYQSNDQLWRISVHGGEPQSLGTLAPLKHGRGGLSIHPDGDRIAFVACGARRSEVWVIENLGSRR
jgi:Tol biopolymer transport system component